MCSAAHASSSDHTLITIDHLHGQAARVDPHRAFSDRHGVPVDARELVANAIAMHHTPGVRLEFGAEAFLLSAGAGVDVFGLRSNEVPDELRKSVVRDFPRLGFKREFAALWRTEAKRVPRGRASYLHRFAPTDLTIRMAPFRG